MLRGSDSNHNRVIDLKLSLECKDFKDKIPKPTTDASWEVDVSEKPGRPSYWNGQHFQYYKKLMEFAARKKDADLYMVMNDQIKYDENFTSLQKSAWDGWQLDMKELIFSSVCTDVGQQLMDMKDGPPCGSTCVTSTKAQPTARPGYDKRRLYVQLESAKSKQNGKVEGHLNYMCRLKERLETVGMTVDDAVFSGMLVVSLLSNEQFDLTFDKANQADEQLHRDEQVVAEDAVTGIEMFTRLE
ncbi:hypothetical protein PInf_016957 [Phytophthora infestans]|nr:hypothetical protein PInf_016957 [Phytophthora infestans]